MEIEAVPVLQIYDHVEGAVVTWSGVRRRDEMGMKRKGTSKGTSKRPSYGT
jgi:hypothetical protein